MHKMAKLNAITQYKHLVYIPKEHPMQKILSDQIVVFWGKNEWM